jgi:hypothetical protein
MTAVGGVQKAIIASRSGSSSASTSSTPTGVLQQNAMQHSNAGGVATAGAFNQLRGVR